jgi:alkane 1-monooxygenase
MSELRKFGNGRQFGDGRLVGTLRDLGRRILLFIPFVLTISMLQYPFSDYELGGFWTFQVALAMFVVTPLADVMVGHRKYSIGERDYGWAADAIEYNALLYLWVGLIVLVQVWALHKIGTASLGTVESIGLTMTVGLMAGVLGIPVAHELMHRSSRFERAFAEVLMCSVSNPQYSIEHVYGHHRHVATPLDPASARLGESLYRFALRVLPGEFKSALEIERQRLQKLKLPFLHYRNRMLRYAVEMALIYLVIAVVYGWRGVAFFAGQGAVAVFLLAAVNYMQHYGLSRKEIAPGVYERVGPQHSWNAAARVSNAAIVNLGRHSDHHLASGRKYQILRHMDETRAPVLPSGLPTMFVLAAVPPLWFRVMDPRVAAVRARGETGDEEPETPARPAPTDGDFARLRTAVQSGDLAVVPIELPRGVHRQIVVDRFDQYGGWTFLASIVVFNLAFARGGLPMVAVALAFTAAIMVALRSLSARWVDDERALRWAVAQPWNWPAVWQDGKVELRPAARGAPPCSSPHGDWAGFLLSRAHGETVAAAAQ